MMVPTTSSVLYTGTAPGLECTPSGPALMHRGAFGPCCCHTTQAAATPRSHRAAVESWTLTHQQPPAGVAAGDTLTSCQDHTELMQAHAGLHQAMANHARSHIMPRPMPCCVICKVRSGPSPAPSAAAVPCVKRLNLTTKR